MEEAIKATIHRHGKLASMIKNAGIIDDAKSSILDNHLPNFERVTCVNVAGVFLGIKHAGRGMIPAKSGNILKLGSISGSIGGITTHAYCNSKHAVVGLTKNAAAELGKYGIRVNCLSSHVVFSLSVQKFFKMDKDGEPRVYTNLKGIVLHLEDLANATIYMASDEARFISRHDVLLDGGFTVINPSFGLFSKFG